MKLKVRIMDAPAVPGGKAIMLCDEAGEPLPLQMRASVENGTDDLGIVTVTFAIDGNAVAFE